MRLTYWGYKHQAGEVVQILKKRFKKKGSTI